MRLALTVIGWLVFLFGAVTFVIMIISGTDERDTQVLANPTAGITVAGAVLILASVLAGRTPTNPNPPTPPYAAAMPPQAPVAGPITGQQHAAPQPPSGPLPAQPSAPTTGQQPQFPPPGGFTGQ